MGPDRKPPSAVFGFPPPNPTKIANYLQTPRRDKIAHKFLFIAILAQLQRDAQAISHVLYKILKNEK